MNQPSLPKVEHFDLDIDTSKMMNVTVQTKYTNEPTETLRKQLSDAGLHITHMIRGTSHTFVGYTQGLDSLRSLPFVSLVYESLVFSG